MLPEHEDVRIESHLVIGGVTGADQEALSGVGLEAKQDSVSVNNCIHISRK